MWSKIPPAKAKAVYRGIQRFPWRPILATLLVVAGTSAGLGGFQLAFLRDFVTARGAFVGGGLIGVGGVCYLWATWLFIDQSD